MECETIHKFANLTFPRTLRAATAPFVNARGHKATTLLLVYSANELDKARLLDTLYQQAITDRADFFGVGDKYDNRAVVLLQTIPANNDGEEPLYCVVGTDKVTIDLLRTDVQFNIAVLQGRRSDFAFEPSNTVISWGRYWRP